MEGHAERRQRLKSGLYVNLGATRDAYMQVWEAQENEIFDKVENFFSSTWHPGIVRALIECVEDEINRALGRECEHMIQAFFQFIIARLLFATIMP